MMNTECDHTFVGRPRHQAFIYIVRNGGVFLPRRDFRGPLLPRKALGSENIGKYRTSFRGRRAARWQDVSHSRELGDIQ
jgi:hypothetical protein